MISKKEIEDIGYQIVKEYHLTTKIVFLKEKQFEKIAKKSVLISQSLKEGSTLKELGIPALVSHQKNIIYISEQTIKEMLKEEPLSIQQRFIQALIYHEIFHLLEEEAVNKTFGALLRSEDAITKKLKKEYPGLEVLARGISKRYLSKQ